MKWYHLLAALGAGFCLGNAVPHFVAGVSGQMFPSPFATPPGVGLSSPLVNALWGLVNIFLGGVLLRVGKISLSRPITLLAGFIGLTIVAFMTSILFGNAMGNPSL
jgi:hypothetical protein